MTKTLFAAILLLPAAISAQPNAGSSADETFEAILAQERHALDRWAAGDPLGYLDIFAEDVTYFDDIRASERIDGMDEMKTYLASLVGKVPPHRYEILDPKVQVYGDVAILTFQYQAGTLDATPLPPWKATSVYRMTSDAWRIVHAHWSLVKKPAKEK